MSDMRALERIATALENIVEVMTVNGGGGTSMYECGHVVMHKGLSRNYRAGGECDNCQARTQREAEEKGTTP